MTHFTPSFRYANVGVRRSAGMELVIGRRFGGYCEFFDWATTSFAVSKDGTTVTWRGTISSTDIKCP